MSFHMLLFIISLFCFFYWFLPLKFIDWKIARYCKKPIRPILVLVLAKHLKFKRLIWIYHQPPKKAAVKLVAWNYDDWELADYNLKTTSLAALADEIELCAIVAHSYSAYTISSVVYYFHNILCIYHFIIIIIMRYFYVYNTSII